MVMTHAGIPADSPGAAGWAMAFDKLSAYLADNRLPMSGLSHVTAIALAFPGVSERMSHGEPCFFVEGKGPLCYFHDNHRGDGRVSLWCPAPAGVPAELTASEPRRFFHPTPSASGVFGVGWGSTSTIMATISSTGARSLASSRMRFARSPRSA